MTDKEVLEALLRGEKLTVGNDFITYIHLVNNQLKYISSYYDSDAKNMKVRAPEIFGGQAEIYKEPVKKYSFREAINMIYEGKIMVSPVYPKIKYEFKDNKFFCFTGFEVLNDPGFGYDEINSNEWTEYKEND